jgi:hypothetical protein
MVHRIDLWALQKNNKRAEEKVYDIEATALRSGKNGMEK